MSLMKRRFLMVLALLSMLLATSFLAESLLLRVTEVQVTGDMVYAEEDILSICGFKTGDNLLFIPAGDREKKLEAQLPYIAEAKISRRIPGTVVIDITAARGTCCLEAGGLWYVVAGDGKVLETAAEPQAGLMQVVGVTLASAQVGEPLKLEGSAAGEEDGSTVTASSVFTQLVSVIDSLETADGSSAAQQFTRMDLSDLTNIRLWYQDRVVCVLGTSNQLEYKVRWGYGNLTDEDGIGPEETGVLDLTYLPTKKSSYFREGESIDLPGAGGAPQAQATPGPDGTVPETSTPEGSGGDTPEPTPEPGRGGDIPDTPFTG